MNHESTKNIAMIAGLAAGVLAAGGAAAQSTQVLFYEGFEGAVLETSVNESSGDTLFAYESVWTDTPPAGWTIDDSGVPFLGDPAQGVEEWEGWSFATIDFWATVGGSSRAAFTGIASGTVAIADGDEWSDLGDPDQGDTNPMIALLSTPSINVAADAGGSVDLNFASSWRQEQPQIAAIDVSFDGGAPVRVLEWTWDTSQPTVGAGGSGNQFGFKADHVESQSIEIDVPAGAGTMQVTFYYSGVNDWWWAIDNVEITGSGGQYLFEDFEGLALEDSVDELFGGPDSEVWTDELPGWTFDDSQMPGLGDPARGVEEWEGWAIADGAWWQDVAGDQRRSDFTVDPGAYSSGNVLIADADEWDDLGVSTDDFVQGLYYNAFVTSPVFDITGALPNTMALNFGSSWRDEAFDDGAGTNNQTAIIEVAFDGGAFNQVLRWSSDSTEPAVGAGGSGNQFGFKNDASNEFIILPLANPNGASSMQIRLSLTNAGNDWWWAVDDLYVTAETSSTATNAPAPFFIDIPSHSTDLQPTLSFGVTIEGVSPDQVVPGAEDFDVIVAKDAAFTDIRYTANSSNAPFVFPQGALQSGVYFVKVVANNAAGSTDSRNVAQFAVSNPCTNADSNGDGLLDLSDITAFVTGFQAPCPN